MTRWIFALFLTLAACAPLIQTGGSVSMVDRLGEPQPISPEAPALASKPPRGAEPDTLRAAPPRIVTTHGGNVVVARDRAEIDAAASQTENAPPRRLTWFIIGSIGLVFLVGIGYAIWTHRGLLKLALMP